MAESADDTDVMLALRTVAHLFRRTDRKFQVQSDNNSDFADRFRDRLRDIIVKNRGDMRAEGLTILAAILSPRETTEPMRGLEAAENGLLFQDLFGNGDGTGPGSMAPLVKYCSLPFEDVAGNSYRVVAAAARQEWGVNAISKEVRFSFG